MFNRQMLRIATVGLLLVPYALVLAQELSTIDLVKGRYGKYAAQLKLADLPDDYSAVSITTSPAGSDYMTSIYPLLGLARAGNGTQASLQFKLSQIVWSNGDTVMSMHREFLVTYKVDSDPVQLAMRSGSMGVDSASATDLFPEPKLRINLIALDSIKSVSPSPDLTKKDLLVAFGSSALSAPVQGSPGFQAAQAGTLSNVKQIGLGMIMYCNDYDDYYPYVEDSASAKILVAPYLRNDKLWVTHNPKGGRILFNMGVAGVSSSNIQIPAESVLIFESEPWEDGRRAVCFCDGHAKLVTDLEWKLLSRMLKPAGAKPEGKPVKVKK